MKYFLGLSAQYSGADVLRHTLTYGSEYDISELRAFLAAHYGATYDHVAVYANGRTALNVAIKAVTKRGGKIIITSLTCYAVVQAIKAAGCVPIFADVDPKTLHFGKKELEAALAREHNVQAVIVQNNLGIPADIAGIEEVANAHKLAIVEDLAHCAGVQYADGREAGTVGRAVALSFGKGKSIDTVTGGAVILTGSLDTPVAQPTKPPKFKDNARARLYPLLSLIIRGLYHIHPKAGKYLTSALVRIKAIKRSAEGDVDPKTRLTFWQCRLALSQLQSLPHRGRKPIRDFYLVNDRETVLRKFELDNYFFNEIWYDTPVSPERYFHKVDFHPDECPVAAKIAQQIVNLPTYYDRSELKSALKIIQRYSAEEIEFEELKDEDNLTEAEKKAKIKAEKKARAKARKAEKNQKTKGEAVKTEDTAAKSTDTAEHTADADEKTDADKESADTSKKTASSTKKAIKKVAKIAKTKSKSDSESRSATKQKESLSVLEEKSSLLAAADSQKQADSEKQADGKKQADSKEQVDTQKQPTKPAKKQTTNHQSQEQVKKPAKSTAEQTADQPKKSKKEPVMRVAPKKLTEREKLKLELESGRKDGPSVL